MQITILAYLNLLQVFHLKTIEKEEHIEILTQEETQQLIVRYEMLDKNI